MCSQTKVVGEPQFPTKRVDTFRSLRLEWTGAVRGISEKVDKYAYVEIISLLRRTRRNQLAMWLFGIDIFSPAEVPAMNRAVCQTAVALLLAMTLYTLASQPGEPQNNPFEAPILDVRPRVFIRLGAFEGLTVAKLREAAGHPEFAVIRAKWRRRPLGQAIEWLITGDRESIEAAIAGLKKMQVGDGSWTYRGAALVHLATLFDWLYDELDQSMRAEIIARIEQAADRAVEHIREGHAPFFYTRTPGALSGLAISGIALHGVSDKADGYLDVFRQFGVNEYFKAYQWVEGAATGGTYTLDYTFVDLPQICAAWWSATGNNPVPWIRAKQDGWLDGIVRFYLWYMRPGFAFTDINDQYRNIWSSHDQFCQGLDIASYVTRSASGRAWSQRWIGRFGSALYHTEYAHNFIFRDVTLRTEPLSNLPRAELFGRDSCGYGFFRSHWPSPGKPDDATHVFFRCGDPMDVHGGVAAGEFQIFKYAPLAARSGRYTSYDSAADQYHRNCISANVILFTDPADSDDRGDQNSRRGLKQDHKTWADWLAIRERYDLDVARVLDWQAADGEARCRADLTATNPKSKCETWIRELVWLADKHLIVLDIVETASARIKSQWQLHCPTPPQIGDHQITISNCPPETSWADPTLQPDSEEARLFCQTVAPRDYTLLFHADGNAQAFHADGRRHGTCEGNTYHREFGGSVVQIDPVDRVRQTVFLHVLTATDEDGAGPPKTELRLARPGQVELRVDDAKTILAVPKWFRYPSEGN